MNIWLLQRNEPTPIDLKGKSRLFRTGIIAEMLSNSGHKVTWWTSDFDHYSHKYRFRKNHLEKINLFILTRRISFKKGFLKITLIFQRPL